MRDPATVTGDVIRAVPVEQYAAEAEAVANAPEVVALGLPLRWDEMTPAGKLWLCTVIRETYARLRDPVEEPAPVVDQVFSIDTLEPGLVEATPLPREPEITCPTCIGTGSQTPGRDHDNNKDTCGKCGGKGTVPLATGLTPEAAFNPSTARHPTSA